MNRLFGVLFAGILSVTSLPAVAAPHPMLFGLDTALTPANVCLYYIAASCFTIGTMSATGDFVLAPTPIGALTPKSGAFTTLNVSGVSTFTTNIGATFGGSTLNTLFGSGGALVSTKGATNAIIGTALQDGSGGNTFITGVTGYGNLNNNGNQAFGIFGEADCNSFGVCTNELDVQNLKSTPPNVFPPNRGFGITDTIPVGLTIASHGSFPALAGIQIAAGGGTPLQPFLAGVYMNSNGTTKYGLFVDATSIEGPEQSALLRNTGQGTNVPLTIQTMGTAVPTNLVISIKNSAGAVLSSTNQAGSIVATDEVRINGVSAPGMKWFNSGAGVDDRLYDIFNGTNGVLHFRVVNDAISVATDWLTVTRTTTTPTLVTIGAPAAARQFSSTSGVPAASACGTAPAVTANSTNSSGQFTTGTGVPTACTITFANAYTTAAFCTISPANAASDANASKYISASSATAFTITQTAKDSAAYNYVCTGK